MISINQHFLQEVNNGNEILLLIKKDISNHYLLKKNKLGLRDISYICFSVHCSSNDVPFLCDAVRIRNGIYNYYLLDIICSKQFIKDNNLEVFIQNISNLNARNKS